MNEARTTQSFDPSHLRKLAAAAHELWRQSLYAKGWRHGTQYDENRQIHDALIPFDQLAPDDQQEAMECIVAFEMPQLLAEKIEYNRGPERSFTAAEIHKGIRVTWSRHVTTESSLVGAKLGEIINWYIDD